MAELQFQNLDELQPLAKAVLPEGVFCYIAGGAEDEATLRDNRAAYRRYRLMPRVMVDVSRIDTSCELLGKRLAYPVLIAPMSQQRQVHDEGELAVAAAAAAEGICMVPSTMSTVPLADVRAAGDAAPLMLMQLYVFRDRDFTKRLVQRAEAAGYQGLVLTVDSPACGKREADQRTGHTLPAHLRMANLDDLTAQQQPTGLARAPGAGVPHESVNQLDASLTWRCLGWLRSFCALPVLVKGVLRASDAERAVDAGAAGVIVSNHGGRQLDGAPATIDALPAIVAAVGGRVPVLIDGGIRRGTDVIKALALGADAVLLGRPVLWGLALGGQEGVQKVLRTLHAELRLGMALMGAPTLAHLDRSCVLAPGEQLHARL